MRLPIVATAALALFGVGQAAGAHARLVAASPVPGRTVKGAPRRINLQFSEAVSAKLSGAVLERDVGRVPATVGLGADGKSLVLTPAKPLSNGGYTVEWHAVASDDGHRTNGTYRFTVE